MTDKLISERFTSKIIKELFEEHFKIDNNKLNYLVTTKRLLNPVIKADGIGSTAVFSVKNLLELMVIEWIRTYGFSVYAVKKLKSKLDKFNPIHKKRFNIFDSALKEYCYRETAIHVYLHNKEYNLYLYTKIEGSDDFRFISDGPEESDQDESQFFALRIDIGKMAIQLKDMIKKKEEK